MSKHREWISSGSILYSELYNGILEPEMKRLDECIYNISCRNVALGASSYSMLLNGRLISTFRVKGSMAKPVHSSLKEELRVVVDLNENFKRKRAFIKNACSLCVPESSANPQDFRDAVSDIIAAHCPNLKRLSRVKPHMYHIQDNKNAIRTWQKAESYLEYYIGNILVFS